jgi:hypothetical protein
MAAEADGAAAGADTGSISIEAATGLLGASRNAPEERREDPAAADAAADAGEADAGVEDPADHPADDASEGDGPGDGENAEPVEPAGQAVAAPHWWPQDKKALFAQLSPELQATVAEQEGVREQQVQRAKQEAAQARQQADAEVQQIQAFQQQLSAWLPQAVQTFQSRWTNVDWVKLAQEDPASYVAYKAQHDAEQAQLRQAAQAEAFSRAQARQRFVTGEEEALKTMAPALSDPKTGPENRQKLAGYLRDAGVPDDRLEGIGALEATIAWKAFQYDQAQLQARQRATGQAPTTPNLNPPTRTGLKPSAQPASSTQRDYAASLQRLSKTGDVGDAVRALKALRKGG